MLELLIELDVEKHVISRRVSLSKEIKLNQLLDHSKFNKTLN